MGKKHGNADFSSGQFGNFLGVVAQRLYPAIKDRMTSKQMKDFSEGQGPRIVESRLREVFCEQEKKEPIVSLFASEQGDSDVGYHPEHKMLEPGEQINRWCNIFPQLNAESGRKHLSSLPDIPKGLGIEGYSVYVKPKTTTDGEDEVKIRFNSLAIVLEKIKARENDIFNNFLIFKPENFILEEKSAYAIKALDERYDGDFIFIPGQMGKKYRNKSVRLAADICAPNEFLLPVLECAESILMQELLIASGNFLRMLCGGERYGSAGGFLRFARSPSFCRLASGLGLYAGWREGRDSGFGAPSGFVSF